MAFRRVRTLRKLSGNPGIRAAYRRALDAPEWRTSKKGKRFQIDTETGEITKGNVGQSSFRSEARPLESTKPDKARYEALLKENDGDHKKAAHEYFREKLQGRYVTAKTDEGEIEAHFTGGSWKELKKDMAIDPVKAEIVQYVPDIIATGRYATSVPAHFHPDVSVFHSYTKTVSTTEGIKEAIVDVAERPKRDPVHLVYSLTREGTRPYEQRKEKESASSGALRGWNHGNLKTPTQDGHTVVEDSIRPFFEVVNIRFAEES